MPLLFDLKDTRWRDGFLKPKPITCELCDGMAWVFPTLKKLPRSEVQNGFVICPCCSGDFKGMSESAFWQLQNEREELGIKPFTAEEWYRWRDELTALYEKGRAKAEASA